MTAADRPNQAASRPAHPKLADGAALAPGKTILCGEHAVVYGAPALALAVSLHMRAQAWLLEKAEIRLSLETLGCEAVWPLVELEALRERLDRRHARFLDGDLAIREVLSAPEQLALYAVALALEALSDAARAPGLALCLASELPIGAGLGSSAATLSAVLAATRAAVHAPLAATDLMRLTRHAERLCHGRGSALDAAVVVHGGCVRVQGSEVRRLPAALPGEGWLLVDSGVPEATTGECVQRVRDRFEDPGRLREFGIVAQAMEQALVQGSVEGARAAVLHNARLLEQIGVVPERVRAFLGEARQRGAVGKISGAGSVRGDRGGLLLLHAPGAIQDLVRAFGYRSYPLVVDAEGTRLVG